MLKKQRAKADMPAKMVYSAMLNALSPASWTMAICGAGSPSQQRKAAPITFDLNKAIQECAEASKRHPLTTTLASADVGKLSRTSLCMQHRGHFRPRLQ